METPPRAGSPVASDAASDISLMSDEEGAAPVRQMVTTPSPVSDSLEGSAGAHQRRLPRSWAEVDTGQLKQLANRIAQRSVPEADTSAEPIFLEASLPADQQAAPHDPLGLAVGPSSSVDAAAWPDPRLASSSSNYDPEAHAYAVYKDIAWHDLIRGLDRLRTEVREHAGQLKALVKENFDRFLNSKDTVDDIATRLKAAEEEGGAGVHGARPAEVAEGVARSRHVARGMFAQLLERHARGESLGVMLSMLGEYDSLVGLPTQVRESVEARDYAAVVALYRKAVKVVEERQGQGAEDSHPVWDKLIAEVNKAMFSAVHILVATIESPDTTLSAGAEAVGHLVELQQAGVPAAASLDPVALFITSQQRVVLTTVGQGQAEYRAALEALGKEADERQRAAINSQWWWEQSAGDCNSGRSSFQDLEAAIDPLWSLAESATAWALEFSKETCSGLWAPRRAETEAALEQVMDAFSDAFLATADPIFEHLALWETEDPDGPAAALVECVAAACLAAQQSGAPTILSKLRQLVVKVGDAAAAALETKLSAAAQQLAAQVLRGSSLPAAPSSLPLFASSLRMLLSRGMRWAVALREQCTKSGANTADIAKPQAIMCAVTKAFVADVGKQAKAVASRRSSSRRGDASLLLGWTTVSAVGKTVLPQIAAVWEPQASPQSVAAVKKCCREADEQANSIAKLYLERKLEGFDGVMEEFLAPLVPAEGMTEEGMREACSLAAGWQLQVASQRPRAVVWTLAAALGALRSELLATAPGLCGPVMMEVLRGVIGGVAELLQSNKVAAGVFLPYTVHQLWLDMMVVRALIAKLVVEGDRLESDAHRLCSALEDAYGRSLKNFETCGGVAADGGQWEKAAADHRRGVERACATELMKVEALLVPLTD